MDQDLFRNILIKIEEFEPGKFIDGSEFINKFESEYENIKDEYLNEHIKLAKEAGFIEAEFVKGIGDKSQLAFIKRLTFSGHQFISKIQDATTWNNIKKKVKEKGLEGSIDAIVRVAEKYIQKKLDE
ncbi:DUF2513 domain-containing protein [Rhodohalobacter sulfatireducens]|nr:DUF2513 domain-containing protein [Rhodohalobacter sulfatireducens]